MPLPRPRAMLLWAAAAAPAWAASNHAPSGAAPGTDPTAPPAPDAATAAPAGANGTRTPETDGALPPIDVYELMRLRELQQELDALRAQVISPSASPTTAPSTNSTEAPSLGVGDIPAGGQALAAIVALLVTLCGVAALLQTTWIDWRRKRDIDKNARSLAAAGMADVALLPADYWDTKVDRDQKRAALNVAGIGVQPLDKCVSPSPVAPPSFPPAAPPSQAPAAAPAPAPAPAPRVASNGWQQPAERSDSDGLLAVSTVSGGSVDSVATPPPPPATRSARKQVDRPAAGQVAEAPAGPVSSHPPNGADCGALMRRAASRSAPAAPLPLAGPSPVAPPCPQSPSTPTQGGSAQPRPCLWGEYQRRPSPGLATPELAGASGARLLSSSERRSGWGRAAAAGSHGSSGRRRTYGGGSGRHLPPQPLPAHGLDASAEETQLPQPLPPLPFTAGRGLRAPEPVRAPEGAAIPAAAALSFGLPHKRGSLSEQRLREGDADTAA
eukprot:TRINITY_DN56319_c0_g1_i1.p2 TRINITY_DN56319_c0_g1~~TRINITY_DN56319_c0_g1_i1.p2  ORF type:complete len:523 (+),score=92.75 TRINITY_DN56319_c0_g1_i1:76-1569(+)